MLLSTHQHPECMEHGSMSLCTTHGDHSPIEGFAPNGKILFPLVTDDDARTVFRSLEGRVVVSNDSLTPVSVTLRPMRDFYVGILQVGDNPKGLVASFDQDLFRILRKTEETEGYIRVIPLMGDTEDSSGEVKLLKRYRIQDGNSDAIAVAPDDDGYVYLHVGFVLDDFEDIAELRLQNTQTREYWFDADDGNNVVYLGIVRVNLQTGDRNDMFELRMAYQILNDQMRTDALGGMFGGSDELLNMIESMFGPNSPRARALAELSDDDENDRLIDEGRSSLG